MSVVSQLIRICSLPTERRCPTSPTLRVALAADNTGLRLCKGWTAATQTCTSIWRCISVSSRYLQMVQNRKSYIHCMRKSDIEYMQISLSIPMVSPWYPRWIYPTQLRLPIFQSRLGMPWPSLWSKAEDADWTWFKQKSRKSMENRVQDQELLFQELLFYLLLVIIT